LYSNQLLEQFITVSDVRDLTRSYEET